MKLFRENLIKICGNSSLSSAKVECGIEDKIDFWDFPPTLHVWMEMGDKYCDVTNVIIRRVDNQEYYISEDLSTLSGQWI